MAYQKIILKKEGKGATITLNRPEVLNALDGPMLEEILDAMGDIGRDRSIWVVVRPSDCQSPERALMVRAPRKIAPSCRWQEPLP